MGAASTFSEYYFTLCITNKILRSTVNINFIFDDAQLTNKNENM